MAIDKDIDKNVKEEKRIKRNLFQKSIHSTWEIEVTEEQREILNKRLEKDRKGYKELSKKIAEDDLSVKSNFRVNKS